AAVVVLAYKGTIRVCPLEDDELPPVVRQSDGLAGHIRGSKRRRRFANHRLRHRAARGQQHHAAQCTYPVFHHQGLPVREQGSASASDRPAQLRNVCNLICARFETGLHKTGRATNSSRLNRRWMLAPQWLPPAMARQLSAQDRQTFAHSSMPASCSQLSAQASQTSAQARHVLRCIGEAPSMKLADVWQISAQLSINPKCSGATCLPPISRQ